MGFFSSFFSGTTADVPAGSFGTDAGGIISVDEAGNVTQDGVPVDYDIGPSLTDKAGSTAARMFTVRDKEGKINLPLTVADTAAKAFIPGYGFVRGGMGVINTIFGPNTLTPKEAAAEQASYIEEGEANLSPSIPQYLLSQGQQDPAAQQALFGPTHIYGALPGQARRRGAYQYIPPTFGPRS